MRVPEKTVQADVVRLLRSLGFEVFTLGTTRPAGDHRGTCQSPGLPDLIAGGRGRFLCVELKARGGRLRPGQVRFREMCRATGTAHVVGGLDDVIGWLEAAGVVRSQTLLARRRDLFIDGDVPEEGEAD